MNLNEIVNLTFITLIFVAFFWLWGLERGVNSRFLKRLSVYKLLISRFGQDQVDITDFPEELKKVVSRCFVIDSGNALRKNELGFYRLLLPMHSVLPQQPTSPYRYAPALLTSLGVLGTFAGISIGLYSLDLHGMDAKTLMGSAFSLLDGMKTAFYTSLAGMLFSIFFMMILSERARIRELEYGLLRAQFEKTCVEVSPTSVLLAMSPGSNTELQQRQLEMADAVIASNESTAAVTRAMHQLLSELDAGKLSDALADAVRDSVKNEITPALQVLPLALQELSAIKQDNGEKLVEAITDAMREDVITPVLTDLKLFSAEVKASHQANNDLVAELRTLTSELGNTTETLNTFQNETLKKLTDFADSLKTILDRFKTDTDGVLKSIADEINHALNSAIKGMDGQRLAFENSADTAGKAFDKQNEALGNIGREAATLMSDANKTLQSGLGDIDGKIREVSSVVQRELESFRTEYQKNLTGFFEQQETILDETLGRQRDGLAGVVADYRKAFEEENTLRASQYTAIKEQYELLQKGVVLVQQLVEAVGLNKAASFDQLQDIARNVGSQVSLLRKEYGQAAQKFSDMTEQLPKAMDSYYQRAETSHSEFFESFDAAAAKVHSRLAEAAGLLVTAMQTIEMHKQSLTEVEVG